jgi:hypothetical protein
MESLHEKIQHRAYDLYLKRGKISGFHEEDWNQAKKEVLAEIEAGKKAEARRQTAVKATPAPTPRESKPVSAPVRATPPGQPSVTGKTADGAQSKPKTPSMGKAYRKNP